MLYFSNNNESTSCDNAYSCGDNSRIQYGFDAYSNDIKVPSEMTITASSKKRCRRRRVSFSEASANTMRTVDSLECMSESEKINAWYHHSEIENFRCNARFLCRKLRSNLTVDVDVGVGADVDNDARGLELRASIDRQKRKFLTLKFVVMAQCKIVDPVSLAILSSKCTAWSNDVAILDGQRDYFAAYDPKHLKSIPSKLSTMNAFPIPMKMRMRMKRPCPTNITTETPLSNSNDRKVRCKVAAVTA